MTSAKFFNTAGPVNQPEHYKIDPLHRWNLDEVLTLISQKKYFILHAPRQTGKTSSLLALRDYINTEGKYIAIYANFEVGQAARNNLEEAIKGIVSELSSRVQDKTIGNEIFALIKTTPASVLLKEALSVLSEKSSKPVIIMIDEIDSLVGDSLISVLRQIRAGYDKRPTAFPSTIILCGLRDIKDYRIHTSNQDIITGGSAFNIKAKSLRLGNFTQQEIKELYTQHTLETGQVFTDECFDLIWKYTKGQPWLVNALGYQVTYEIVENRDRLVIITPSKLEKAKEQLILSRQTHLDQLADKLSEDRVRRVILPMIEGLESNVDKDDEQYCIDLGLISISSNGIEISNDIYKEIIPRELTESRQRGFLARFKPEWIAPDGSIDTIKMLTMYREFWMENQEIWASHIKGYQEAAPHLVTQAFLQRVANGNGIITREYAAGRKRVDLMLKWKYEVNGEVKIQRIVLELKVINQKDNYDTIKLKGLEQTAEYASTCNATESHLLIFDRDETRGWKTTPFNDTGEFNNITVQIWGF